MGITLAYYLWIFDNDAIESVSGGSKCHSHAMIVVGGDLRNVLCGASCAIPYQLFIAYDLCDDTYLPQFVLQGIQAISLLYSQGL